MTGTNLTQVGMKCTGEVNVEAQQSKVECHLDLTSRIGLFLSTNTLEALGEGVSSQWEIKRSLASAMTVELPVPTSCDKLLTTSQGFIDAQGDFTDAIAVRCSYNGLLHAVTATASATLSFEGTNVELVESTHVGTNCSELTPTSDYTIIGQGGSATPYLLCFPQQFVSWSQAVDSSTAGASRDALLATHWRSGQSLDFSGHSSVTSIGWDDTPFTGSWDGNGYIVSELNVSSRTTEENAGLFVTTHHAEFKNLTFENLTVTVGMHVDEIFNFAFLIGKAEDTQLQRVVIESGSTNGANEAVAGVMVGRTEGSSHLSLTGVGAVLLTRGTNAGGLVGHLNADSPIERSYSYAEVRADYHAGGIVGISWGSVSDCYSAGDVHTTSWEHRGGIIGYNNGTVTNCYSTTILQLGGQVGAIAGFTTAAPAVTFFAVYWDEEINPGLDAVDMGNDAGALPLTTAQSQQQSSYVGWDFTNIWGIVEGLEYPHLRGFQ